VLEETISALGAAGQSVIEAGGLSEQVVKVDDRYLILLMMFASPEDAARVARDVGGPFMREHIVPLLADDTDRGVGEVILDAHA
jgi:hypothetical protein